MKNHFGFAAARQMGSDSFDKCIAGGEDDPMATPQIPVRNRERRKEKKEEERLPN